MRSTILSTLDGGWIVHPSGVASTILRYPQRHHEVLPRNLAPGSYDDYVLPVAFPQAAGAFANTLGMRIPIGTKVWVHNRSAVAGVARIVNTDASLTYLLAASCSVAFVLTAASSTNSGTWRVLGNNQPNAKGPDLPEGFFFELDLRRSQNNVDVLVEAVDAGYDGTEPAIVRVRVWPRVVIGSTHPLVKSLDMGGDAAVFGINWFAGSIFVLTNDHVISGCGGDGGGGGIGGTGASAGVDGGDGGCAIRAPRNLLIVNNGVIQGGGGGGGGGNGSASIAAIHGGGGAGGAGATILNNGFVRGGLLGVAATGTTPAGEGTLFLPGAYGNGTTDPVTLNFGGHGGTGGAPAAGAGRGQSLNNGPDDSLGGAAGAAISRDTAATITFATGAGGIVTGSTIVE